MKLLWLHYSKKPLQMSAYELWVRAQISDYKKNNQFIINLENNMQVESQTRLATQLMRKHFKQIWDANGKVAPVALPTPEPAAPAPAPTPEPPAKSQHTTESNSIMCTSYATYSDLITNYKKLARGKAPEKPVKSAKTPMMGRDNNMWKPYTVQVNHQGALESTLVWIHV